MRIRYEKRKLLLLMIIEYIVFYIGHINSVPLHTASDELGAIVGAASFAGLDWSGVIKGAGYYGFGYYGLYFWVFKLTDNPIVIYRIIAAGNALLKVLIIPIAFYISKIYLRVDSEKFLYFCAGLMPFLRVHVDGTINNEYPLELMFWIIVLLSCKVIQYYGKSVRNYVIYVSLLLLCCLYILTLHTRALTVVIAVSIIFFGYFIMNKSKKSLLILIIASFIYFIGKKISSFYQAHIWGNTGGELVNGSVAVTKVNLFDIKTWSVWFHMLLGMVDTEILLTAGVFILSIVVLCLYSIRMLKNRFKETNNYCNVIFLLSILCIGATIAAFLVSNWFGAVYAAWDTESLSAIYETKSFTYVRYWNVYMPPMILCALGILQNLSHRKICEIVRITLLITLVLHVGYIKYIVPIILNHSTPSIVFFPMMRASWWGSTFDTKFFNTIILVVLTVSILMCLFIRGKHYSIAGTILILFAVWQVLNESCYYDDTVESRVSSMISASYEMKTRLETEGYNIGQIYLNDIDANGNNNWDIYYTAQFYFNRYSLQIELPEQIGSNDIIISDGSSEEIEIRYPNLKKYILDDNEIWYTCLDISAEVE